MLHWISTLQAILRKYFRAETVFKAWSLKGKPKYESHTHKCSSRGWLDICLTVTWRNGKGTFGTQFSKGQSNYLIGTSHKSTPSPPPTHNRSQTKSGGRLPSRGVGHGPLGSWCGRGRHSGYPSSRLGGGYPSQTGCTCRARTWHTQSMLPGVCWMPEYYQNMLLIRYVKCLKIVWRKGKRKLWGESLSQTCCTCLARSWHACNTQSLSIISK